MARVKTTSLLDGFYSWRSGPSDPAPGILKVVGERCWGSGSRQFLLLDCGEWWNGILRMPAGAPTGSRSSEAWLC